LLVLALACTTAAVLGFSAAALGGSSAPALKTVRYRGIALKVPPSWPVFDLARNPSTCVRFDRHAVYLGTPGAEERCPAHAVGRTEAILVSPVGAEAGLPLAGNARSFAIPSARVQVTATWWRAPLLVASALGRRSLPAASGSGMAASNPSGPASRRPASPHVYTGRGFDTCATPSPAQMSAWASSPYRAIGIYIGGANTICAERNLNRTWVREELASGWHLAPFYVGPQAVGSTCPRCTTINSKQASGQGVNAANDAVKHARALGIPAGSPIYYDLESYHRTKSVTASVLAFFRAWTRQLHADGYTSGFYSSALSGITDLVHVYKTKFPEPDDIWIADWNGKRTTQDPHVPGHEWANHQRLHQYVGPHNETYDTVTLNIDGDVLNGATSYVRPLDGYLVLSSDGGVHNFGTATWHGSDTGKLGSGVRAVALARNPVTSGYWVLKSDGGVDNFGNAPWKGSLRGHLRGSPPVALAGVKGGYYVLTADGGVHNFGAARAHGSDAGKLRSGVHAVALAVDSATGGYWVLRSDGAVDGFHAPVSGSLKGKVHGTRPVAIAAGYGGGYLVLNANGGVHAFGPAASFGSLKLSSGVRAVALETSAAAAGYRILRSDGGVNGFHASWNGSLKGWLRGGVRAAAIAAGR
jgi:hypothetical protein